MIVSRDHHFRTNFFATPGTTDIPFKARHFLDLGLAGENPTTSYTCMEGAHFAWSGDGEYFLPGNGPLRGRKWNEPFPANIHFLANIAVGDVGPAGRSGRWIVGSTGGGNGPVRLADLRSGEVIAYKSKTPTSFRGLTRGLQGTNPKTPLRTDRMLISLESLLLPPEKRTAQPLRPRGIRDAVKNPNSPLMWQRSTNIYVAVVRHPDRPCLRARDGRVELIPGENHWETRGYRVLRNGEKLRSALVAPGATLALEPGIYTVAAVEWSGLESLPSLPLELRGGSTLAVLQKAPADFRWTAERWLSSAGQPISEAQAQRAPEAACQAVHLYDGVIRRQGWRNGQLAQQDDLNGNGQPIRRLSYENAILAKREYLDRGGNLVSTELFDAEGFITYSAGQRSYPQGQPAWKRDGATVFQEWFSERGVPVRWRRGSRNLIKQGDRWIKQR
ncbi:MAG: hypothetical protein HY736_08875 [Verrucomicrobia bacterium]|nr:hypothetical protein [Verrucomicrobiota bacterium]